MTAVGSTDRETWSALAAHGERARPRRREEEPDEAVQHGELSAIQQWPRCPGRMRGEVGDRHLARQQERDGLEPEAEQCREAAEGLQDARDAELGCQWHLPHRSHWNVEELLRAVRDEEQSDDDAQQALEIGRP